MVNRSSWSHNDLHKVALRRSAGIGLYPYRSASFEKCALLVFTALIVAVLCSACEPEQYGFFGFGNSRKDIRSFDVIPVFEASRPLYWAYQLRKALSPNLFGVKLERNVYGWTQIETVSLRADEEFHVLSGRYPPMKPGLYKITIYHNMKIIDQGQFRLIASKTDY